MKVSSIAKLLNIRQPSVVNKLHRLNEENFVEYSKENIAIRITVKGEQIARHMIRNTRLLEILMRDSLRIAIDGMWYRVSLESSECLESFSSRQQFANDIGRHTNDISLSQDKISCDKIIESHTQDSELNDTNDTNDILHYVAENIRRWRWVKEPFS